jgi:hypothetical protein
MHKYTVQFRIEGRLLVPSDVTKNLGLNPCQVRLANEQSKRRKKALWAYDGSVVDSAQCKEWDSLEDGLVSVLGDLALVRDRIMTDYGQFDMCWWCGHFQSSFDGGPKFSVSLLEELAKFGVPLYLDNYFFEDEDEG